MKPFKLKPYYAEYLWGGRKLKEGYGKTGAPGMLAESWELSARPGRACTIDGGEFDGMGFDSFVREHPGSCRPLLPGGEFPLLIKLIDANKTLSIQVHPGDAYARAVENSMGKTELWIVLECEQDAFIYHGFKRPVTKDEAARVIADGSIADVLRAVPVKPGDVFFIPSGTVHALGAGVVIAEIQQNSDATYRVYDFGRVDSDGKPRELHVEKALDVMLLTPSADADTRAGDSAGEFEELVSCEYFKAARLRLNGSYEYKNKGGFAAVLCVDGSAAVEGVELRKGGTVFIPSDAGCVVIEGAGEFIITRP